MIAEYGVLEWLGNTTGAQLGRACRQADGAPVLVKVLDPEHATPALAERLRQEYELLQALDVPGLIKPLAFLAEHGYTAVVLEDVAGRSLDAILHQRRLDLTISLRIACQLARTLAGLHAAQVIHQDLRPANLLLDPKVDTVCLVDCCLAARQERAPVPVSALAGDPAYLSPEQTGRMNRAVDYRTDFYSLGVLFYQLLTGQLPFQASDPLEWVHCHLARLPRPPAEVIPGIPLVVSEIVLKLLAKVAEDRYQSASGLQFDLEQCLAQWETTGQIAPFVLRTRDISDRFQISQQLYDCEGGGRDAVPGLRADGGFRDTGVGAGQSSSFYQTTVVVSCRRGTLELRAAKIGAVSLRHLPGHRR